VYQADFNQERGAREKIAGEKADLEEEIRKIKQHHNQITTEIDALQVVMDSSATVQLFILACCRVPPADRGVIIPCP
jgi:predicted  nucleic acid-binding Zn-ribbon protein